MSSSTSMKAYLAAHYMSGPKAEAITARLDHTAKKKKKKAKAADSNAASSSFIKDMDDDLRWGKPVDEEEDEEEKAVVEKDRSFKKRKVDPVSQANDGGGWIKIQGDDGNDGGVEEVAMEETHVTAPAAGLVLPSEFKSALPQQPEKKKKKKSKRAGDDDGDDEQGETVYRDASGRRIQVESAEDIAARQAEEEREKREREREKKEWQKGLVQREQAESRRREEAKERTRDLARRADDKDLNEIQKAEERWNDPAAAFLTKKEKKGPKRPEYKGPPPPPNRFGIKPGYRWDGVDRSNGFEKKYFQTINEKGRTKLEAYQWSVDDM